VSAAPGEARLGSGGATPRYRVRHHIRAAGDHHQKYARRGVRTSQPCSQLRIAASAKPKRIRLGHCSSRRCVVRLKPNSNTTEDRFQMAKTTRLAVNTAETGGRRGTASPSTLALRLAAAMGLLDGPTTKHFNAKVNPALFDAAARRAGTSSPAGFINAALAALATEDELGPWLARNWGILADVPNDVLDLIDF
jgi:hypothetical protein